MRSLIYKNTSITLKNRRKFYQRVSFLEQRELKRLKKTVPDSLESLSEAINSAKKLGSFDTIIRLVDNFMKKHRNEELTSLRQTKVQIVKQFGGTSKLEEEIKIQLILYLFEVESSFLKAMAFYISFTDPK